MESNASPIAECSTLKTRQSSPPTKPSKSFRVLDTEMQCTVIMELLVDKLKLLNYELEFCKCRSPPWPRLHKFYFALPSTNHNEQFSYFSAIVAWLFGFLGCQFPPPSEVDDPNITCSKIMTELMNLGFGAPNWPPAQLKQGYGDAICSVLDALCSLVLDAIKYEFTPVTHLQQEDYSLQDERSFNDNPSELYIFDEQGNDNIPRVNAIIPQASNHDLNTMTENAIHKWKLDLERIAPQLCSSMVAEVNDWRAHLDCAKKLYKDMFSRFDAGKPHFKKLEEDVTASLDKLESHETFINHKYESLIAEYVAVKGRVSILEEKRKQMKEDVTKLTSEHAKTMESLQQVKQKMVEKGNEIADMSPMLHMKATMQKLKTELRDMEVQIGVLEHTLVQAQTKRALEETKI